MGCLVSVELRFSGSLLFFVCEGVGGLWQVVFPFQNRRLRTAPGRMIGISGADADPAEMPGVSAAASVLATKAGSV